jgi:hypothetical protein
MRSKLPFAIASTFALCAAACMTEPGDDLGTSADELGRAPVHAVTAGGQVHYPHLGGVPDGYSEKYAISARQAADGTVDGQVEIEWDPPFDFKAHGEVTCLNVQGQGAWLGVVLTHSDSPQFAAGTELVFFVQDNGAGNDSEDAISFTADGPADRCSEISGEAGDLFAWTGNVTVR